MQAPDQCLVSLVDIVRLEGLALYSGDDDFSLRQSRHDSTPGTRLLPSATTASAFAIVDSVQLEGAWHRLLRNHDDDDFDYDPQRTFAPSATNPGQEGLGRDHGRLAEPGGQGLPSACERRPKGVTGFGRTESSTSTTSTTSATLEQSEVAARLDRLRRCEKPGAEAPKPVKLLRSSSAKTRFIIDTEGSHQLDFMVVCVGPARHAYSFLHLFCPT